MFSFWAVTFTLSCKNVSAKVLQDDHSMVISGSESLSGTTEINKDVYVVPGTKLILSNELTINGNLYIWGHMQISKPLIVNGTANMLKYTVFKPTLYSDLVEGYDYGSLVAFDTATIAVLNLSDNYLNTEVPSIPDKEEPTDPSGGNQPEKPSPDETVPGTTKPTIPSSPVTTADCQSIMVVSGNLTISNQTINKTLYIPKNSSLSLKGTIVCNQDIFVFGTLNSNGILTVNGTIHCLHYGSMMSAGEGYDYGYFYSSGKVNADTLDVTSLYLQNGIPETVHTFGEWQTIKNATTLSTGLKKRQCLFCNTTDTEDIPKLNSPQNQPDPPHTQHQWEDTYILEPTCSSDGYRSRRCIICSKTINFETIPATGLHNWEEWVIAYSPSCVEDGKKYRFCKTCNKFEESTIPSTEKHDWSEWYISKDPTCIDPGEESRDCNNCSKTEHRTIPATGDHWWDDWYVAKKATVFKTGLKKRQCIDCSTTQTKTLAKLKPFVKITKKPTKLQATKTYKLKLKYAKGDAIKKWKSSNTKVATVSKAGVVKAKKKGTVKITVTMKSGKKATCKISVTAKKKKASSDKKNSGSSGNGTVYWTPGGSVYHSTKNCPTLSRSRTVYSGSKSKCPKSRKCKVCY